jgi:NTP pyrophosphatase (non-canonical NTP hydrolase)
MKEIYKEIEILNNKSCTTVERGICKLFEECGEFAQAANKTIGIKISNNTLEETKSEILEEGCDVIQNVFSIMNLYGISYNDIVRYLPIKNKKWESKL